MDDRPPESDAIVSELDQPAVRPPPDPPSVLMLAESLTGAPVLIVDDEPANLRLVNAILSTAGYTNLYDTTDPIAALEMLPAIRPSLLLLDLHMPALDGFAFMRRLQQLAAPDDYLPVLVLTADATPESRRQALAGGAHDVLIKPLDATEVRLRVTNLLRTHALYAALQHTNSSLEQQIRERTEELDHSRMETLRALALAAEFRDDDTGRHTQRVGQLAAAIGETLGLAADRIELLRRAAPLHDIGKIGIPDHILLKPGRLSAEEFLSMQRHTTIGFDILAPCQSSTLQTARGIALTHHERWDGAGYPNRIAGEAIPLDGRIVACADAFDAMTNDRPYRPEQPVEFALDEIQRGSGSQFDPEIANALRRTVTSTDGPNWK